MNDYDMPPQASQDPSGRPEASLRELVREVYLSHRDRDSSDSDWERDAVDGDWVDRPCAWCDEAKIALDALPAASGAVPPAPDWQHAALLKDRTRRAIRDRVRAGEAVAAVAQDYGVPVAFVEALAAWQLAEDSAPDWQLYDAIRAANAVEEAQAARYLLGALLLDAPNCTLTVSDQALAAVKGSDYLVKKLRDEANARDVYCLILPDPPPEIPHA